MAKFETARDEKKRHKKALDKAQEVYLQVVKELVDVIVDDDEDGVQDFIIQRPRQDGN